MKKFWSSMNPFQRYETVKDGAFCLLGLIILLANRGTFTGWCGFIVTIVALISFGYMLINSSLLNKDIPRSAEASDDSVECEFNDDDDDGIDDYDEYFNDEDDDSENIEAVDVDIKLNDGKTETSASPADSKNIEKKSFPKKDKIPEGTFNYDDREDEIKKLKRDIKNIKSRITRAKKKREKYFTDIIELNRKISVASSIDERTKIRNDINLLEIKMKEVDDAIVVCNHDIEVIKKRLDEITI